MKRQGTSKFVAGLIENWLKEIRDPEVLNQIERQVIERKAMLMIETTEEQAQTCIDALPQCKVGDVLHLMHALPVPSLSIQKNDKQRAFVREDMNRMKCKFHQWQPRRKILWVTVRWTTRRQHYQKNFVKLELRDIQKLQPSRTEREIRLKLQQGRS